MFIAEKVRVDIPVASAVFLSKALDLLLTSFSLEFSLVKKQGPVKYCLHGLTLFLCQALECHSTLLGHSYCRAHITILPLVPKYVYILR